MSLFDPPWRFDPYQNPTAVQWGGYYCLFQLFASNVLGGANVLGPNNHVVTVTLKNGAKMAHERNQNIEDFGISFYEGIFLIDVPGTGDFITFRLDGSVYGEGDPTPPNIRCAYGVGRPGFFEVITTHEVISEGAPLDLYDEANWVAAYNAGIDNLTNWVRRINPFQPPFDHIHVEGLDVTFMRRVGATNPAEWVKQKDSSGNTVPCGSAPPPSGPGSPTYLSLTVQWFLYPKGGHKVQPSDKYFPIRTSDNKSGIDLLDAQAAQGTVSDGTVTFAISLEKAFLAEDTKLPFVYPSTPFPTDPSPGINPVPYVITGFRRSAEDPFVPSQWGLNTGFVAVTGPPSPGPS